MKKIAVLAACVAVLWTMVVSAESTKQPFLHTTRTFEVPLVNMHRAGIRIRCDSGDSTACTAFLDCHDQGDVPENISGELGVIPDQTFKKLTERDISTMTDAVDLKWPLSCEVRSTHPVKVQVLVRSGGVGITQWSTSAPGPGP